MRERLGKGLAAAVTAAICAMTLPAWAGYSLSGYNLEVVASGQGLPHAGISYLDNATWNEQGGNLYEPISTSFTLPSCNQIDYARLYLDIWGGMPFFTASVTVSVNGTQLPPISIGGMGDTNPTYSGTQTCVYGSGYGVWELGIAGVAGLLHTNGIANTVTWTVNDPTGEFDGRTYDASLVTVYTSSTLNQTLDYDLAEANAYVQNSGDTGAPSSRTLSISGVNTANMTGATATYSAGYILGLTGSNGCLNSLSFNNQALGNPTNDVAQGSTANFGPSIVSSNVTASLSANNTVVYNVGMAGGTNNLVPTVGLLAITRPMSVNGAWSGSGGGSWNTAANWQGSSVPGNSGDTAAFGTAIGSARATVTLDGSRTLAALAFNTSGGGSYTISRSSGDTTSTLTLTNTSGTVSIADSGGNQTIAVPVVLGSNLSVSATAGSSLTISAPVSQANAGTSVTLTGGGTLILSGSNTYTGGTTISGGTLEVANAAALPAKGIINVGRSGTVNLTALLVLPATAETSADEAPSDTSANEASLAPSTPGGTASGTGGGAALDPADSIANSDLAAVPEPGTMALGTAAAGLLLAMIGWGNRPDRNQKP
ncbi:MAG: autotransporter-associated beta strand repeat-containing protein [Thermoguttaceae bacterium]